jgi:hypothetical protein
MYLRTVKVRSSNGTLNEYVRVVEAYRDNGKVKRILDSILFDFDVSPFAMEHGSSPSVIPGATFAVELVL